MLYRKWGSSEDEVVKYTSSVLSDKEIMDEVKLTMKVHVIELYLDKVISKETCKNVISVINSFKEIGEEYEDVHEALEDYIIKKVGKDGDWIGLGRSRNDHVATALRVKARNELLDLLDEINKAREKILEVAESSTDIIFPTFTHLQPAQPSTLAHYLLYLEEELSSRWKSIFSSLKLVNRSPLGSGAIVGTNFKLNREREAELLGFDEVIVNTISATSSRGDLISAVLEVCNLDLALSRFAEDMVFLSSKFVDLLELPDSHVSTSSLMPQKRNPVTMEILRAKAGECLGNVISLSTIYKGLPSGYDLDIQEMNPHYWIPIIEAKRNIEVIHSLIQGLKVKSSIKDETVLATDEAELLSMKGVPYREAYFDISTRVRQGSFKPSENFESSIRNKAVIGSPNPEILKRDLKDYRERLERDKRILKEYKDEIFSKLAQLRALEDDMQEG
ncbi:MULTISPECIES: argininosuccinate lyase [Acidianus]|uniref:Argininosuccinate lyase n=1 Tax=Candidatus Acidianus copahuensis TaxID=1160895 RepID=A0A031LLC2_9CREN|nr:MULTISPECIES: argininosuccinate lyase [Acidianus]EZQ04852.1 argininosuccinate lyase [Candidatus Acidianus copahuensis]NON62811.1 argininosuccinate lyase [Acidianus sp. RZ1]